MFRSEYARIRMGTRVRIVMYAAEVDLADRAAEAAFARIERVEGALSDWRLESEVVGLRAAEPEVWHAVSPDLDRALQVSCAVRESTGGAFDPACGRMSQAWRRSRELGETPVEWAELIAHAGPPGDRVQARGGEVRFRLPVPWLDFGGVGKGLAADAAIVTLRDHGIASALVDIGGDMAIGAPPPGRSGWRVRGAGSEIELVLAWCGVATSGGGAQHIGPRSHIIDPRTGRWMQRHDDVTVIAPSGAMADALASAGCVLGAAALQESLVGQDGITVLSISLPKQDTGCQVGSIGQ